MATVAETGVMWPQAKESWQSPTRSWKKPGSDSPRTPPEGASPAYMVVWVPGNQFPSIGLQNWWEAKSLCCKSPACGDCYSSPRETVQGSLAWGVRRWGALQPPPCPGPEREGCVPTCGLWGRRAHMSALNHCEDSDAGSQIVSTDHLPALPLELTEARGSVKGWGRGKASGNACSMAGLGLLASNVISVGGCLCRAGSEEGAEPSGVVGRPPLVRLEGCSEQSPHELGSEASLPCFASWLPHPQAGPMALPGPQCSVCKLGELVVLAPGATPRLTLVHRNM